MKHHHTTSPWPLQSAAVALIIMTLGVSSLPRDSVAQNADADGVDDVVSPLEGESSGSALALEDERAESFRERLAKLDTAIRAKQALATTLQAATPGQGVAEDFQTADELGARIEALRGEVGALRKTFEQLAAGGVDRDVFSDKAPEKFVWQDEVVEISKPIFDELRGLTEKPRQIERLRRQVERAQAQAAAAERALAALVEIDEQALAEPAAERVQRLTSDWTQRRDAIRQSLEVASLQLDSLLDDRVPLLDKVKTQVLQFLRGRGLTLLVALGAAVAAWLLMRALLGLIESRSRRARRGDDRSLSTRYRLLVYAHRLLTIIAVTIAVLAAFSFMGDFLLLTVGVIAVAFALVSLRKVLPAFIAEAKLLVGLGAVREGERAVYEGLPYEVKSINVYSVLRNPRLEGVVRLPLRDLTGMVSRPCRDEPWFPSSKGDFVFMDDKFGQVVRQTREFTQLQVLGGMQQLIPSVDFAAMGVRNVSSGETFLVPVTFGIDYAHQAISQDDVGPKLQQAVESGLRDSAHGDHLEKVVVDFKSAATNSLDYLVLVTMRSGAAGSYFAIDRRVQQICVGVCNREGWGIPFAQLTVHGGSGLPGATVR